MRRRPRLILTLTGWALFILGIGGFVVVPFVSATVPVTTSVRFPLGEPESVDADAAGRIYVADGFCHRVQRFSPGGDFEIGWYIDALGPYRLRVMPDSTIEVAVAKARSVFVYTADGKRVTRRPLDVPFEEFVSAAPPSYAVRGVLSLRPGIIRIDDGRRVVADTWLLLLIRGPVPAWCFAMIGIAILALVERSRRSRRLKMRIELGATATRNTGIGRSGTGVRK